MSVSSLGLASYQYQRPTFSSTDTDGDGALSLSEFGAVGQNVQGGSNGLDSNSIQQIFSAIDTDGDGKVSRSEATSAFDKLSSALQSGLLGAQEQFGGPPPPPNGGFFASADTDGSGGLSFDEFKAAANQNVPAGAQAPTDDQLKSLFDKLDKNGDGSVSQDELKKAGHHRHHHAHAAPPPDQTASDGTTADPSSTATSASAAPVTSLSDLFQQAVSAYSSVSQPSSSDLVGQILDVLKAA